MIRRFFSWLKACTGCAVFVALFVGLVVVGLFRDPETEETLDWTVIE